jgi:hypothetical protein
MAWGDDNLSQFLNAVHSNQKVNAVNFPQWYAALAVIDDCFVRVGKNLTNPVPVMTGLLLRRCQYAYKTAAGLALAGQVVEVFSMLRSALEYAAYCLAIFDDPTLEDVWMGRHVSAGQLKAQKQAFAIANVRGAISRRDAKIADIFDEFYQRTIDFGGHPNPHGAFSAMILDERGAETALTAVALSNDSTTVAHALKSAAEIGLTALHILQHVFEAKFELLGIRQDMQVLKDTGAI